MQTYPTTAVSSKLLERGGGNSVDTWRSLSNSSGPTADKFLFHYATAAIADPNLVFSLTGLKKMIRANEGYGIMSGFRALRDEGTLVIQKNPEHYSLEESSFDVLAAGFVGWLADVGTNILTQVEERRAKWNEPVPVPALSRVVDKFFFTKPYIVDPAIPDAFDNQGVQYLEALRACRGNLMELLLQRESRLDGMLADLIAVSMVNKSKNNEPVVLDYEKLKIGYCADGDDALTTAIEAGILQLNDTPHAHRTVQFDPTVEKFLTWQALRVKDMDFIRGYASTFGDRIRTSVVG